MRHLHHLSRRGLSAAVLAVAALAIGAVFGAASNGRAAATAKPSEASPPTISGTAQEGKTLTADAGNWNGTQPLRYAYQWRRCDTNGGACASISRATARLYDLVGPDVGHTLRVHVTVSNRDGNASDTSVPTAVVTPAAAPPPATGCPAGNGPTDVTNITPPANLVVDAWAVSPTPIGRSPGTLTMRFHVTACGGRPVAGALIYATAVPFDQFSIPAEAPTGADGWASLTMNQDAHYPASSSQGLLAVFVRARKSGENILGGISARRLVSFPVSLH
jgi:hypothetical protein